MNHPNQLLVKSYSDIALNKEDTILSSRESTAVSRASATPRRKSPLLPKNPTSDWGAGTPSASFRYSRARWS